MIYKTKPTLFYIYLITIATSLSLLINVKGFDYSIYDYIFRLLVIITFIIFDYKTIYFFSDKIEIHYPFKFWNSKVTLHKEAVVMLQYINNKAPLEIPQFFIEYKLNSKKNNRKSFIFISKKNVSEILEAYKHLESVGWKINIINS